eukprot:jgi/Mesen1/4977/ME000248S04261
MPLKYSNEDRGTWASFDNEFRSSRGIAQGVYKRYKCVEFVRAGVTAYAVGCTEEGLRKELLSLAREEAVAAAEPLGVVPHGTATSLSVAPTITQEEVDECLLWVSIVFITIMSAPEKVVLRWSTAAPVSAEAQLAWRGFCKLIANAYYLQGMAWFSVRRLQMEQMAVVGHAEEAAIVSDRMRLVFTTLEVVTPQWPSR